MKIENLNRLLEKLKSRETAAKNQTCSVIVGYTANYAIYVHENLEAKHTVGQAKFLEEPARRLRGDMANLVLELVKGGKSLPQALLIVGLRLQRESMQLVPVDTGNLRASAFTRRDT